MSQYGLITPKLVEKMHKSTFTVEGQEHFSDEDVLGIHISKYFPWNAHAIIRTCHAALEDSSFYIKARQLAELFPEAFSPNPYAGIKI